MSNKLSVLIITKNEEEHMKPLLSSIDFADEIVVLDSYSTDKTTEIAEEMGAKVLYRKFDYHAAQKNWGLEQLKNDWVLIVDADERIPEDLKSEIKSILNQNEIKEKAFWIKRINYLMDCKVQYSGWQNDKVIRLFDRKHCKYNDKLVHEEIETTEKIGVLKQKLEHYTYKDFKTYFEKFQKYSTQKALIKFKKGKKAGLFELLIKPGFKFFQRYIMKLGILDGKIGVVVCSMAAFHDFLVYLKMWRMQNGEKLD
ncbi:glycosyltransferase family 2 protein [Aureivirga sp. CE67]|uniref:glycosyltransferase family 2 protein n=1 Tax=Aureivirga sp. CE67 TaxID=1788983 RepID=UPI0018CB0F35|nr:glycosyltransferase family 2 protein [Aureivirga sp. CE67]